MDSGRGEFQPRLGTFPQAGHDPDAGNGNRLDDGDGQGKRNMGCLLHSCYRGYCFRNSGCGLHEVGHSIIVGAQGFVILQPLQHTALFDRINAVIGDVDVQPEVIRLPAVLPPFQHRCPRIDCGDGHFHGGLGTQQLVDAPAVFQRPALFFQRIVSVPPVHLEIIGQNIKQPRVQPVDDRVDAQLLNFVRTPGQQIGHGLRQRNR